ncbi:MAG: hypothetical protein KZQ70_10825 [gamma proteobacterium symbiont of Lucinoma myriamae]|nr:hypothetical protein [gamma proteobacterium symbiont of Lucinoma myriamae]MCU7818633.1 hypothetical protein [gamma proteobacterium symbiont of Lucinoma myriamae]MCU7832951.1 hypothetical protein [gamma proteobacterium symbiont of Lucinoma myriamae]
MSQVKLVEMADILLPVSPEQLMPIGFTLVITSAGFICIVIVFFFLWRYLTQPLMQLERHLKQNKLSSREAAHVLASIVRKTTHVKDKVRGKIKDKEKNKKLMKQIDQLRFQRSVPKNSDLLNLISSVKHGR